ncbi:MAG: hypothetical protein HOA17_07585 [Candidatus Melainabacteria bacterium]|nr:hypothetical protein [Candidatus Melainabacteria bacterium]
MSFLALIPLLIALSWLGYKLNKKLLRSIPRFIALPGIGKIAIDLVLGFSAFFLAAHLTAFPLNSFINACYLISALILLWFIIDLKNLRDYVIEIKRSETNWSILIYALVIGFLVGYKNLYVGDSAKFHFTLIGSLANNHIYPPITPFDFNQNLSGYHFGIIAISALFKIICGFNPFMASALQLGLQAAAFVTLIYSLFFILNKDGNKSLLFTLVFVHFYAILNKTLVIPWMVSRSHTLALSLSLVIIISIILLKQKNKQEHNWLAFITVLTPISFFLYFAFPADWYPIVAGIAAYLIIEALLKLDFSKNTILFGLVSIFSLALGKVLTLMKSFTSLNDVEALVFKPGFRWFSMLNTDSAAYPSRITSIQLDQMVAVPLWSWYSFKSFLLLFIITTIIFLIDSFHFKSFKKSILYFAASASMLVPFLYVFEPYPKDTQRFLFYAQLIFLLYILLFIAERLEFKIPQLATILCACSIASFAYLVLIKPEYYKTYAVPDSQRALVKELEDLHQTGDVLIDTEFLHISSFYSNIAGYYGIGGHFYSADMISRSTAIYLLNPLLLQELGADYLLLNKSPKISQNKTKRTIITNPNQFSPQAIARVNDHELFEIIQLKSSPTSILLKFIGKDKVFSPEEIADYHKEYIWIVGKRNIYNFSPITNKQGELTKAQSRAELEPIYRKMQKNIAKTDTNLAVSLSMGVMPK